MGQPSIQKNVVFLEHSSPLNSWLWQEGLLEGMKGLEMQESRQKQTKGLVPGRETLICKNLVMANRSVTKGCLQGMMLFLEFTVF